MESGSRKVNELRAMFHCQIPRGKEAKRLFSVFFVVIERLELFRQNLHHRTIVWAAKPRRH